MSDSLPDYLSSTVAMLEAAYPTGIPEADELPLMRALYDHMSDRNLALVMAHLRGGHYAEWLHQVWVAAAELHESSPPVQAIVRRLEPHGYAAWRDED